MPDNLWNARKYLGDVISLKARGNAKNRQAVASQSLDLKPTLADQIDAGAFGFKIHLEHYEEVSRPIDAMRYPQGRKLADVQGNVQLSKLAGFLDAIEKEEEQTGKALADSVTPEQSKPLQDLRDDVCLASRIDLGKARGSDTNFDPMTTTRLAGVAQGAALKLAAMDVGLIENGVFVGLLTNGAEQLVTRRMISRMGNTQDATLTHLDNTLINFNRVGVDCQMRSPCGLHVDRGSHME
ncbi:hypothetical protein [Asaia bogorensis]|uniref:hypothetical protein n=1 Tax=Asaia bogorensis TaxID=91915 RepID=UPI0013CF1676|nr:hypothetical protein [Asaia bogorensis]